MVHSVFMSQRASHKENQILNKEGEAQLRLYRSQVDSIEKFFRQRGTLSVKILKYLSLFTCLTLLSSFFH